MEIKFSTVYKPLRLWRVLVNHKKQHLCVCVCVCVRVCVPSSSGCLSYVYVTTSGLRVYCAEINTFLKRTDLFQAFLIRKERTALLSWRVGSV